jgi:nucleotide-binding universal stress UspA family protein
MNDAGPGAPRHILVPLDLTGQAPPALAYAAELAQRCGALLSLLHVLKPGELDPSLSAAPSADATEKLRALAEEVTRGTGVGQIATTVAAGPPVRVICQTAKGCGADLIAVGMHEHGDVKHSLLGGTADSLVRLAPCPVLVLRDGAPAGPTDGRAAGPGRPRLLVPVDFSARAEQAIVYATTLAGRLRGTVSLVYILDAQDVDDAMALSGGDVSQMSSDAVARLEAMLERTIPLAVRGAAYVRRGVPFAQIVAAAGVDQADLLVLTTHGRTGLAHLLLGSTAERVIHHASAPVLVVRGLT